MFSVWWVFPANMTDALFASDVANTPSTETTIITQPDEASTTMIHTDPENPFFKESSLPLQAPDFAKIKPEHYMPAFEEGMKRQLTEVLEIANNSDAPTFENTIVAMERTGDMLTRVGRVFSNMTSSNTNPELQAIQTELAPKMAAHSDNIYLNANLFARIQTLKDQQSGLGLTTEQSKLLDDTYKSFVRAGAKLTEAQKERIREINSEISSATTEFQKNLLQAGREGAVLVETAEELAGFSEGELAAAAQLATSRGHEGMYMIPITNTTRQPALVKLDNRDVRQRVWEASANRATGLNGGVDNRPLVLKLARLRAEKAAMLGYESWAAYALEPQMAGTPEAASTMLQNLASSVVVNTEAEAEAIRGQIAKEGQNHDLKPWDWEYYAEKVRQAQYDLDEDLLKPYFEFENVLQNGVYHTMNLLFGVTFEERFDIPVYAEGVRVFDVFDADGSLVGLFYADYFTRDSKRGGAWMSSFVSQSGLLNQKPVILNNMNIPVPAEGEPSLVSYDNVSTMFHEMGHAVHGLFSDVTYPSIAGTSVPRDFVEYPSTFQEDWSLHPDILANYAKHHQTGEPIPADLLERLIAAKGFNQGFDTQEYLAASLLDMEWHSLSAEEIPTNVEDVTAFEKAALAKYGLDIEAIPPRYKSQYFAHIFSGGYSASYYAYIWSEVLAADAFEFINENGGPTLENGTKFRDEILSRGGSEEPMKLYINYRGQEPTPDALLRRRGLTPVTEGVQ